MTLKASQESPPPVAEIAGPPGPPPEIRTGGNAPDAPPPGAPRKNLASALFLIGQPLLLNALSIPATAYIIRILGPYQYAEWAIAASLVGAVACLSSLGLRSLFIRSISRDPAHTREALGYQMGLRGSLAVFAGLLALLAAVLMGYTPVVIGCVVIASVSLLVSSVSSVFGDVMQGFQRFKEFAVVNLVSGVCLTVASVLAVLWGKGPLGLSAAYLLGPIISLLLFYAHVRKSFFRPSVRFSLGRFKDLLYDVRMLGSQQVLNSVMSRAEQLLVPKLVGYVAMGYFSAGLLFSYRLEMIPDGISTAFFPLIAKDSKDDPKAAARQVSYLMRVSLAVCVPMALLAVYIASPLAGFFFKKNPEVCTMVMWITIWSLPFQAVSNPMNYALQANGRHSEAARRGMGSTLSSSLVSVLLIYRFGLIGACLSWVTRQAMVVAFLFREFHNSFPTVFPGLPLARILLSGGVMAGVLWASLQVSAPKIPLLMLGCVAGTLVYAGSLVLFRVVTASEIRQLLSRDKGESAADAS